MKENSPQSDKLQNNLRWQSLDLLRFPLAVVVLLIHVFCTKDITMQGHTINLMQYTIFVRVDNFISAFLRGQSVPIYFFISGFVFFLGIDKFTKAAYFKKLRNRVKTLLVPYIILNTVAILLLGVRFLPIFDSFIYYSGTVFNPSLGNILSCFWIYNGELSLYSGGSSECDSVYYSIYPINGPLWFIRDLIIVVLCTPIIYVLIKQIRIYYLLLLAVIWFSVEHSQSLGFAGAFFFFSWGAYMSINKKDIIHEFGKYFKISLLLYPLLALMYWKLVIYNLSGAAFFKRMEIIAGLFFAYNIAVWLLQKGYCKVNPFLASASFFIYVSHALVVSRVTKVLALLINPSSNFTVLLVYILSVVLSVLLLLSLFYILKCVTPNLLDIIVASRKPRKVVS